MTKNESRPDPSPSQLIDGRIKELADWRGDTPARLRALIKEADPAGLFNSSLEGNVRRAIDFHEGDTINEKALKTLIRAAVRLNASKAKKK